MKIPWFVFAFIDRRWPRLAHRIRFGTSNVNTAAHWDAAWSRHGHGGFRATDELRLIRHRVLAAVPRGVTVLDVGCGAGELLGTLRDENSCICAGLDLSPVAVAAVRQRGIEARAAALPHIPYEADRFDVVVCTETLEHVSDVPATLHQIARVLRPNGMLVVSVPDGATDREAVHVHRFTRTHLHELLDLRFRVDSIELLRENQAQTLFAIARKAEA